MTSISTPRDDDGVIRRRLQRAGTAPVGKSRRSMPTGPARRLGGQTNDAAGPQRGRKPTPLVRGSEQRVNERRRHRTAVVLDTRSAIGNRRRSARRGDDRHVPRRRAYDTGDAPAGTILGNDICA